MPRRLIPVKEELVHELAAIAKRTGLTLTELTETILKHAAKTLRGRDDIAEILADSTIHADITRLGGTPIPLQTLTKILQQCSQQAQTITKETANLARLIALSTKARGIEPLKGIATITKTMLPNIPVDIIEGEQEHQIIAASPHLSTPQTTQYATEIIKAILEAYEATITTNETTKGLINIKFKLKTRQYKQEKEPKEAKKEGRKK